MHRHELDKRRATLRFCPTYELRFCPTYYDRFEYNSLLTVTIHTPTNGRIW